MIQDLNEIYMQRCLQLAQNALTEVAPNPMVGCVIVHNSLVLAEGFHQQYGKAHAEVNAINNLKESDLDKIPTSTLFVNLEPCAHQGKTPPCAHLIIDKGFKRVVIANKDPNPLVSGKGINLLKNAGIEVIDGMLQKEAAFLNRRFFTYHNQKRPYLILKWAESVEGNFCPKDRSTFWMSNEAANLINHQWRSEESAILVGKNTAKTDNPRLTVRKVAGKNPLRVLLDFSLELENLPLHIFDHEAATLVFNQKRTYQNATNDFVQVKDVNDALHELYKRGVLSMIVEGGYDTLQHFIQEKLYDEVRIIHTEKNLEDGLKISLPNHLHLYEELAASNNLIKKYHI